MEKEVNKPDASQKTEQPVEASVKSEVVTETKSNSNNNKVIMIVLIVIGALIVLGVVGSILFATFFTKATEKVVENATNTNITTDKNGTTTITSKDGSSSVTTSTEQKLPADFPSSIPLYSSQKITTSYKSKNSNGSYWQVVAEVSGTTKQVADNLKSKYSAWESSSEIENDGSYVLSYKNSSYTVDLTVSADSNKQTTITYMVSEVSKTE